MRASSSQDSVKERTLHVLSEIFAGSSLDNVGVRLWDGTAWPDERPRAAVVALNHSESLARMFLPGTEVGLAEAYLHGAFDIEGDMEAAFEIGDFLLAHLGNRKRKLKLAGLLVALPGSYARSSIRRAAGELGPRTNCGSGIDKQRDDSIARLSRNLCASGRNLRCDRERWNGRTRRT